MVVRFDSKLLQQTVERKAEPIGVEGDRPSKKGGMSEADAIVNEAKKSMSDGGRTLHTDEEVAEERVRVSQEVIREEEEQEVGPEVDAEKLKNMKESQRNQ